MQTISFQCVRASPCPYTLYSLVPQGILIHLICSLLVIHHFSTGREAHASDKRDGSHLESRRPDNDICVGNGAKMGKIWKARQLCSLETFTSFLLLRWALLTWSTKINSSQVQRTGFEKDLSQAGWDFRAMQDSTELILQRGEKAPWTVSEKSLRWSLFSRSLDSVLDLGDQWHQEGLVSYGNYSVELNELKRGEKVEKNAKISKMYFSLFLRFKLSF